MHAIAHASSHQTNLDDANLDRPSGEYPSAPYNDADWIDENDINDLIEADVESAPRLLDATWDDQTVITFVESTVDDIQRMPPSIIFQRYASDLDACWKQLASNVKWLYSLPNNNPVLFDDDLLVARMFLGMGDHPYDIIPMLQAGGLTVTQAVLTILFAQGDSV